MNDHPTVFIVDDDEAVRDSLGWLMQSVGLPTETFSSAQDFLEADLRGRAGCLLLDIRMPGMSGLELQERLEDMGVHVPVIIITGHGDVPMAVRALKAGAMDFIEKPFNDQVILDCVQAAIEQDNAQREALIRRDDISARIATLTPREREVLDLVVAGKLNKIIAADLGVSQKTVEAHRAKVMEKLEARSVSQLVRMVMAVEDKV
jgi:RNA polymerase sigma factor (sigma-70 family)